MLRGHERRFAAGETLMSRGELSDVLMLVTGGSVRMERPGRTLTLGPGSLIGEIEVLNPGQGRVATITAEEDTTVIAVTRDELLDGARRRPEGGDRDARDPGRAVPGDRREEERSGAR